MDLARVQWIESQAVPTCPVCKAGIGKDKVIPVYTRGKEAKDPRYVREQNARRAPGAVPIGRLSLTCSSLELKRSL